MFPMVSNAIGRADYREPPVFRGAATSYNSSNTATSLTVTMPTYSAGDRLVVFVQKDGGDDNFIQTPTGWAFVTGSAANDLNLAIYTKIATGSEGSSVAFTSLSTSLGRAAIAASFSNASSSSVSTSAVATFAVSSSTAAGAMLIRNAGAVLLHYAAYGNSRTHTAPSGMTERLEYGHSSDLRAALSTQTYTVTGSTGSKTGTLSGNASGYVVLVAIEN